MVNTSQKNKVTEQEKFYGFLNRQLNDIGNILLFIIVWYIIEVGLNLTFYYSNPPAPIWIPLVIEIAFILILKSIHKNRK